MSESYSKSAAILHQSIFTMLRPGYIVQINGKTVTLIEGVSTAQYTIRMFCVYTFVLAIAGPKMCLFLSYPDIRHDVGF